MRLNRQKIADRRSEQGRERRKDSMMFNALRSAIAGIVGLCALAAVPIACIIAMEIVPDRPLRGAQQTAASPAQIGYWLR